MSTNKGLLLIMGAVMMLASAASAQVFYCEKWDFSWGFGGTITYDEEVYSLCDGDGFMWCVQDGHPDDDNGGNGWDYFLEADWWATLVSEDGDSLKLSDSQYDTHIFEGWKVTGQSSIKEGYGTWCAYDSKNDDYLWGTWTTIVWTNALYKRKETYEDSGTWNTIVWTNDNYCFNYNPSPPTCKVRWYCEDAEYGTIETDENASEGDAGGNRLDNQDPCREF